MTRPETPWSPRKFLFTGHFITRDAYYSWREHGTPDYLLVFTLGGCGRFGHGAGEIHAVPGDIVMLHPGAVHDYSIEPNTGNWELLWSHFHPRAHWQELLHWPEVSPGVARLQPGTKACEPIVRRMFDVHHLSKGALVKRELFAMNALEEVLLLCDSANPLSNRHSIDPRVASAMDFFCRNSAGNVTIDQAAESVGISTSRLAHLFRQQAGITPQQFLEKQRLDRAAQLLDATQLSIKEISRQVGFANPFYFTLRFKRQFGRSPLLFRKNLLAEAAPTRGEPMVFEGRPVDSTSATAVDSLR
jgi:AraC family transcriptional regulator of arabinose operon